MHSADDNFDRYAKHQWRRFEAMARRGWGGWGRHGGPGGHGGPGDWSGFGDNFRIGRMLASGDLRLIALYFIEEQPRHGYDLIKAIEDKTGGIYVPSPGVIYPALTFLEEAGYVTSEADANKRLYTITEEGKAHLNDNRTAVETTLEYLGKIGDKAQHLRAHWEDAERRFRDHGPSADRDMNDVIPEVNDARRELKDAIRNSVRSGDPAAQRRLADILRRAANEIRQAPEPDRPAEDDIDL